MTRIENSAETGLADGTNITIANSDDGAAGTAFVTVTGAAGTVKFSTLTSAHGTRCHREIIPATTGNVFLRFGFAGGGTMAYRSYFLIESNALTGTALILRLLNGSAAQMAGLQLSSTLVPQWLNSAAAAAGPVGPGALSLNTWYRFEGWVTPGLTATTGRVGLNLYLGDGVEPFYSYFDNAFNAALLQTPRTQEWGRSGALVGAHTIRLDDWVNDDGIGEVLIGPPGGWGSTIALKAVGSAEGSGTARLVPRPISGVRLQNTMETGLADGTTATTANSDDGTAGDPLTVAVGASATITYESAAAIKEALGIRIATPVAINNYIRLGAAGGPITNPTLAARFYFRPRLFPSVATNLAQITNAAAANVYGIRLNIVGTFQVINAAGTVVGTPFQLVLDTVYRVEMWVTHGTTTTDGRVQIEVFAGDDTTTPLFSWTSVATNASTSPPRYVSIGRFSTGTGATFDVDDFVIDDAIGEDFIGPTVAGPTIFTLAATGDASTLGTVVAIVTPSTSLAAVGSATASGTVRTYKNSTWDQLLGTSWGTLFDNSRTWGNLVVAAPTVTLAAAGSASSSGTVAATTAAPSVTLAAVGSASSTGTAAALVAHKMAAVGSGSSTGTVVAKAGTRLLAVGSGSSTGTVAALVTHKLAAVGSASSTGTMTGQVNHKLAAVGSALSNSTVITGILGVTSVAGIATSSGTVVLGVTHKLAAVGSASSTGTAAAIITTNLAAVGSATSTGLAVAKVGTRLAAVGSASSLGTATIGGLAFIVLAALGSALSSGSAALSVGVPSLAQIYLGDTPVSKLYVGRKEVLRAYVGTVRVK